MKKIEETISDDEIRKSETFKQLVQLVKEMKDPQISGIDNSCEATTLDYLEEISLETFKQIVQLVKKMKDPQISGIDKSLEATTLDYLEENSLSELKIFIDKNIKDWTPQTTLSLIRLHEDTFFRVLITNILITKAKESVDLNTLAIANLYYLNMIEKREKQDDLTNNPKNIEFITVRLNPKLFYDELFYESNFVHFAKNEHKMTKEDIDLYSFVSHPYVCKKNKYDKLHPKLRDLIFFPTTSDDANKTETIFNKSKDDVATTSNQNENVKLEYISIDFNDAATFEKGYIYSDSYESVLKANSKNNVTPNNKNPKKLIDLAFDYITAAFVNRNKTKKEEKKEEVTNEVLKPKNLIDLDSEDDIPTTFVNRNKTEEDKEDAEVMSEVVKVFQKNTEKAALGRPTKIKKKVTIIRWHKPDTEERPEEYECYLCNMKLKDKRLLKLHINIFPHFKCKSCNIQFSGTINLQNHKTEKHTTIDCKSCDRKYSGTANLQNHKTLKHTTIDCHFCKTQFSGTVNLQTHKTEKHTRIVCDFCKKKFSGTVNLQRHKLEKHRTKLNAAEHKINDINLQENTLEKLETKVNPAKRKINDNHFLNSVSQNDMSTINKKSKKAKLKHNNNYECVFCSKEFQTKNTLEAHIDLMHKPPLTKITCELCNIETKGPHSCANTNIDTQVVDYYMCPHIDCERKTKWPKGQNATWSEKGMFWSPKAEIVKIHLSVSHDIPDWEPIAVYKQNPLQ